MNPLTVIATLKAKNGSEDALLLMLKELVAPTRAEQGCLSYDLHRSHDDPGLFIFTESWASRSLWEDHLKSAHLAAFGAKRGDVLESSALFTGEAV